MELWSFTVAATVHAIWMERLRRMEDSTVSTATHTLIAESFLLSALTRFKQTAYVTRGADSVSICRTRAACADLLANQLLAPALQRLPRTHATDIRVLFFDGGSRGNPGPGV